MRYRALAALAGRKAHRSVSRSVFLRHSPLLRREWCLLAYDESRAFGGDTVTLPARPEESGPHFRDPRRDCPGRLVDALGRLYGGDVYNSLETEAPPPGEFGRGRPSRAVQRASGFCFGLCGSAISRTIGCAIGFSSSSSIARSSSSARARQNAFMRAS